MPKAIFRVTTSLRDGYVAGSTGGFNRAEASLYVGNTSSTYNLHSFAHLTHDAASDPAPPKGATIQSVVVRGVGRINRSTGATRIRYSFEAADNPVAPTSTTAVDSAPRTSKVLDTVNTAWATDQAFSYDITTPAKEVLNRPGYTPGNPLNLFLDPEDPASTTNNQLQIYSYDGSATKALYIEITYQTDVEAQGTFTLERPRLSAEATTVNIDQTAQGTFTLQHPALSAEAEPYNIDVEAQGTFALTFPTLSAYAGDLTDDFEAGGQFTLTFPTLLAQAELVDTVTEAEGTFTLEHPALLAEAEDVNVVTEAEGTFVLTAPTLLAEAVDDTPPYTAEGVFTLSHPRLYTYADQVQIRFVVTDPRAVSMTPVGEAARMTPVGVAERAD